MKHLSERKIAPVVALQKNTACLFPLRLVCCPTSGLHPRDTSSVLHSSFALSSLLIYVVFSSSVPQLHLHLFFYPSLFSFPHLCLLLYTVCPTLYLLCLYVYFIYLFLYVYINVMKACCCNSLGSLCHSGYVYFCPNLSIALSLSIICLPFTSAGQSR